MHRLCGVLLLALAVGTAFPATLHASPALTYGSIDAGTDLARSYFGARYYASGNGRFTTVDPRGADTALADPQQFNRYAYARNNPFAFIDPTGEAIELVGKDDAERQYLLDALCQAVGPEACPYLYAEADANDRYWVKIYTNGPTGRRAPFAGLNAVAKAFESIINDERIVHASVARVGKVLTAQDGRQAQLGPSPLGTPAATFFDGRGQFSTVMMDSGPGFVPGGAMSNGRDSQLDPGLVIAHELGHVAYAWVCVQ